MQTSPGSQINWLLQRHPSTPGGEQAAPPCLHRQRLPAAPGWRFGMQSKRTKPRPHGAPQAGSLLSLCALTSTHASLSFSFALYFASHSDPYDFSQVFALCVSSPDSHGLVRGEGECERAAGRARGYLHFTCRIWSLRLAWM